MPEETQVTQTTETKPSETTATETKTEAAVTTETKKEASPLGGETAPAIDYSKIEYKFPEGIKLEGEQRGAFDKLLGELKLPAEAGQKLLDMYGTQVKPLTEAITKAVTEANTKVFTDLINNWKGEIDKDPDLGGANREAAQTILGQTLDTYFTKEAREAFDLTGAGWNPHIIRGILKMAKALSEGQPTEQGKPVNGAKPKTPGGVFYGDTSKS